MKLCDAANILRPVNLDPRPVCEADGCDHGYVQFFDEDRGYYFTRPCVVCDGTGLAERRSDGRTRAAIDTATEEIRLAFVAFIREQDRIHDIICRQRDDARAEVERLQTIVAKCIELVDKSEPARCEAVGKEKP